ncbi:MAG TPA: CUAEP/CCAEP-tail radical SAM protein [Ktedonobacterales bacterium]|nr:CUAEP/CCAEP-tail radical SAM protein [Ktedonobacterales bacterium]
MRSHGRIALVACYELGHQPLSLASPLATLRSAGFDPVTIDTSVETLDDATVRAARIVAISVPMHTALRLGVQVAERARAVDPFAYIVFYGLYASLNAEYLLRGLADAVIGGEYEQALLALAEALDTGADTDTIAVSGVRTRSVDAAPVLRRLPFSVPARDSLPPMRSYAHLVRGDSVVPAGYVEATRGCLHTCLHCPITPVYGGRFFVVPRTVVLDDIRAQVAAGARHITFGDPDFLNGPGHSLAIARALHAEFPDVTFDATIKVEHILERREAIAEFGQLGCAFIVSAVESLSPRVLAHLAKGHTRADVEEALRITDAAGIPMRPTFVAFTPWTSADDFLELLDFVAEHELVEHIDPVQYAIRLLVPPGSALLSEPDAAEWLGPLDESSFSYQWTHPDARMDALQREVMALVELSAAGPRPIAETFAEVYALAERRLGRPEAVGAPRNAGALVGPGMRPSRPIPHLTEAWFC